jgi:hypothetical protein
VVFHVLCWSPFWLFNLFSSIFRLRISTQFDRVVVNIIHLFPYINCALNPILYVAHAENFRLAFRSLFCPKLLGRVIGSGGRRGDAGADGLLDGEGRSVMHGGGGTGTASSVAAGNSVVVANGNGLLVCAGGGIGGRHGPAGAAGILRYSAG